MLAAIIFLQSHDIFSTIRSHILTYYYCCTFLISLLYNDSSNKLLISKTYYLILIPATASDVMTISLIGYIFALM